MSEGSPHFKACLLLVRFTWGRERLASRALEIESPWARGCKKNKDVPNPSRAIQQEVAHHCNTRQMNAPGPTGSVPGAHWERPGVGGPNLDEYQNPFHEKNFNNLMFWLESNCCGWAVASLSGTRTPTDPVILHRFRVSRSGLKPLKQLWAKTTKTALG